MKFFVIFLFTVSINARAELNLEVVENNLGKNYYLVAQNCSELNSELNNFKMLQNNYSPSFNRQRRLECLDNNYSVNLTNLLPEKINTLLNSKVEYYGPNCWNSVIFSNSLGKSIRFFTDNEFEKALVFYGCKKKSRNDKIIAGDIIRTIDKDGDDLHSFIFISNNFSFTKNGPETKFPYEIKETSNILSYYGFNSNCLDNQKIQSECQNQISAYDCTAKGRESSNEPSNNGLDKMVEEAELRMTYLILNYRSFPNYNSRLAFIYDLRQKITSLYFIINNDLTNGKLDQKTFKKEDFYMSKVLSLMTQLNYF